MGWVHTHDPGANAGGRLQLALRGGGWALLAAAGIGGRWLALRFAHGAGQGGGDVLALAIGFAVYGAGSAGLMLATLGAGLMQRIAVPGRYRRHDLPPKRKGLLENAGLSGAFFDKNQPDW